MSDSERNSPNALLPYASAPMNYNKARKIMDEYLNTPFEGGRHQARVDSIPVK